MAETSYMSIIDKFEQTVTKFPDKTAIADAERNLSFSELRIESLKVATLICDIQKESAPIVVLVDRTIDTVSIMLGVLYTGSFYIPLDPNMPKAKIVSIINDSDVHVIVGKKAQFEQLDLEGTSIDYIDIATKENIINLWAPDAKNIESSNPIYMIYTSGSTGIPKGVLKSHGSVLNFLDAYVNTFGFSEKDTIGNQSPLFFDASAKDLYLMVYTGATLEILPTELFSFPPSLIEYMNERQVSFISWVPTALSLVVQLNTFLEIIPSSLKRVFFVGEVMPIKYLIKWKKYLPDIQYVNLYGSSEIAGICCYYEIKDLDGIDVLPIGKPLCNCSVILLSEDGHIVNDLSSHGEICISSDALALAYYNDDEETQNKFQTIQMDGTECRIYKTGDIGKYDAEGNLVYVGRRDFQIKHHGHRIELGEIETQADLLQSISKSACLYNDLKSQIVLFCELDNEKSENSSITEKDILNMLRGKISGYMLPEKIVIIDSMPLNTNGKIDRQSLKNYI